jgi:predicted CXXCH cytochrome family protein
MKKIILITVVVLAGVGLAGLSQAVITGSGHDLTAVSGSGVTQICIPCHTPHNADTTIADAPLWNHAATTATYQMYDSDTFTGTAIGSGPTGVSKLCLSCHDGTVAPDAFTGHTAAMAVLPATIGAGGLGTDLRKSHPISFTFDAALVTADGDLKLPPEGWMNGTKFECSSCHDVHNKNNLGAMLHIDNTNSALCLSCHVK